MPFLKTWVKAEVQIVLSKRKYMGCHTDIKIGSSKRQTLLFGFPQWPTHIHKHILHKVKHSNVKIMLQNHKGVWYERDYKRISDNIDKEVYYYY